MFWVISPKNSYIHKNMPIPMVKRKLIDFFGVISKETGEAMLRDLKKFREIDIKLTKERIKEYWGIDLNTLKNKKIKS